MPKNEKLNKPETCFKSKQEKFCEKNRGFVDSEFMKTCHEHVIYFQALITLVQILKFKISEIMS